MSKVASTRPIDCSVCRKVTNYLTLKQGGYWVCSSCNRFLEKGDQ